MPNISEDTMKSRLSVSSPLQVFHVNQHFGGNLPCVKDWGLSTQEIVTGADDTTCPAGFEKLYEKFGMKGHSGVDLQAGEQNVYASISGTIIEKQTVFSRGLGIGIITDSPVSLDEYGEHYAKVRTWHMKSFSVEVGQHVEKGDLIGISDNTGYSSGDHVHWELVPMDKDAAGHYQVSFPNNGYVGAIDIYPFYDGLGIAKEQIDAVSTLVSHITPESSSNGVEIDLVMKIINFIKQELGL